MSDPVREDPELRRSLTRWEVAGIAMFAVLVAAFPLFKAVEGSRRADALASQQAALLSSGQRLWSLDCSSCHGDHGEGVTAPALNSKQFLSAVTDEQVHGIVAGGIPGTAMPAWWNEYGGPLTDEQILAIVTYVRAWQAHAPNRPDWRNPGGTNTTATRTTRASSSRASARGGP